MADLSVTAASVTLVSGSVAHVTAGATVTAGQAVSKRSDGQWDPANADGAGSAEAAGSLGFGLALNGAAAGQPLTIQLTGEYDPGATAAAGAVYVLSAAAAGGIAPVADLVAIDNDFVTIVGVGNSTGNIDLCLFASGSIV